ncbi:PKD domain-containing protein [Chroococcus sp. FPU101]|uniref:PKD domain-containing protein n=1 Tax=Chroococcus sp. FPU101 TaxID=1974212 RepID=UPI001A8FCE04|nr:PKD domain-containing protein [Chroococcus sp. FPU101]GFE70696.1 hypothetical protein CFPU101_33060 [Chroococcus sp. FPU101]
MTFNLNLNTIVSPINENGTTTLTGLITDLDIIGGEVTLDIDWGVLDINGNPITSDDQTITIRDGGPNDADGLANGRISFSLTHQYLDDNPTATPSDTYTIQVDAKEEFLIGTDAVYVIDISGSTSSLVQGLTTPVGDQNGDGSSNTILDVEIASFKALNQELRNRGLGNVAEVSIVAFSSSASRLDMEPGTTGFQSFTTPDKDSDNNGIKDVDQVLMSLDDGGSTNYEAALQQAIAAVTTAGTVPNGGNVIFLSDGLPNTGGSFTDEANVIRNTKGQNLRAFGVGTGAQLSPLQQIDPNAQVFTNPQDLLNVFGGAGAGTNQDFDSIQITVNNVAPTVNIALSSITINENSSVTVTGSFTDPGTFDTHSATINWGNGTGNQALTLNQNKTFSATYQYLDDGSFGGTPQNGTPFDIYTITVSITDDDTGVGTASANITVNDVAPVLGTLNDNLPGLGIIVEGDTLQLSANYTDVGTKDFHTVKFNWGDGSPINSSVKNPLNGGIGTASDSHVYTTAGSYTATLMVTDDDTLSDSDSVDVIVAKKVVLDWKPGSNPSSMNFTGGGTIPVAILGASNFDVRDINVASIKFDDQKDVLLNGGGVGVNVRNNGTYQVSYEDTNSDGYVDLVAHVNKVSLRSVVNPNQEPFRSDQQIYAFGAFDNSYFFGIQQAGDPIRITG